MFNIIDRYIAKLFLAFFLGGIAVFVVLFVAVDFMTNISRYGASSSSVVRYYALYAPSIAYQMMAVSCLLGTIFTLSTLNKNNELVALFSSGMSLARISTPILVLVVVISSVSFWLNDRLLPTMNQKKSYIEFVEIKKKPGLYSTVKSDKIWYRSGNILFNIKTLSAEQSSAQGLTMYYFDNTWRLIQMITAKAVSLNGQSWELSNGTVTLFTNEPEGSNVPMTQNFQKKTITVAEDTGDIQKSAQSTDTLRVSELRRYIDRNKAAGLETLRYEVDYQAKFSFAFAAFVMSFLGIPFSATKARQGGAALNIGITILLAFGYYAAYSSGITLGRHAALPPIVAVWIPNLAGILVAVFFLFRLKR
jgi:lipopolysaccharide export system permease protein